MRGSEFPGYERTIDAHVKNLRRKLGRDGARIVETVLGVGYRLGWSGDRLPLAGPLGRRLLAAFLLVALSSVAVLTVAAPVATERGLASAQQAERQPRQQGSRAGMDLCLLAMT